MSIFEKPLSALKDDTMRGFLLDKFNELVQMIDNQNKAVSDVRDTESKDANNHEYLNRRQSEIAKSGEDKDIVAWDAEFQKLVAAEEKLLAKIRARIIEKHLEKPLTEKEKEDRKRFIISNGKEIAEKSAAVKGMATLADQFLELAGAPVKGGIFSLMPQPDSLGNARGRKPGSVVNNGEGVGIRLKEIWMNDKLTNKMVKGKDGESSKAHFRYLAEEMSAAFNAGRIPSNKVTDRELEEMFYEHHNAAFRDTKADIPETSEFTFEKAIQVQNPNDDSTHEEVQKVKIKVVRRLKTAG